MAYRRTMRLTAAAVVVTAASLGGAVFATPGSGIVSTAHVARATLPDPVHLNADGIRFRTKDATDVSVVSLTMAPGATTGWHRHPGLVIIAVSEGTGTYYSNDCTPKTYSAGDVFVETGDDEAAVVRNESGGTFKVTVTLIADKGAAFRIDEPNPGCAGID